MQILLFVMSMLLLLSAITYAKMDSYRSMVHFRNRFEVYSEARNNKFERDFFEVVYDNTTMSTKESSKDSTQKSEGNTYISLVSFSSGEDTAFTKLMLKELIAHLYEKQPFFQELLKKRPQLSNEIVEALEMGMKDQKKPLNNIEELANIEMKDPVLAEGFYKILKGFTLPENSSKEAKESGYPPLTCYLSLKGSRKIRAYLAPKAILEVLFNDPQTVSEVMNMRTRIYRDLINGNQEDTKLFGETFSNKLSSNIPQDMVDFSVSKTNPNRKCVRFLVEEPSTL